jgi:cell division protein FtsL
MTTQRIILQAIVSTKLRQLADRVGVDENDDGFTTVEKVVLTAIAVAIAIAAGVAGMIDSITGP